MKSDRTISIFMKRSHACVPLKVTINSTVIQYNETRCSMLKERSPLCIYYRKFDYDSREAEFVLF